MAEVTTDHHTIVKWAEARGGKPAAVDAWGPKVLLINGSAEVTLPGSERAVAP